MEAKTDYEGILVANTQVYELLSMVLELRNTLFVRPVDIKQIESKAVALCDAIVLTFE